MRRCEIDHDAGVNGIDQALRQFNLDAIVSFTDNPAWETDLLYSDTGRFYFASSGLAAAPGYPIIQVPATMVLGNPYGRQLSRHRFQRTHADQARVWL